MAADDRLLNSDAGPGVRIVDAVALRGNASLAHAGQVAATGGHRDLNALGELLRSISKDRPLESLLADLLNGVADLAQARAVAVVVTLPAAVTTERLLVHRGLSGEEARRFAADATLMPAPSPQVGEIFETTVESGRAAPGRLVLVREAPDPGSPGRLPVLAPLIMDVTATAVALIVDSASQHTRSFQRERWLEAVVDIAGVMVAPGAGDRAVQAVCEHARMVSGADVAWVMIIEEQSFMIAAASGFNQAQVADMSMADQSASLSAEVIRTGVPVAAQTATSVVVSAHPSGAFHDLGPAVLLPAAVAGVTEGMIGLAWSRSRTDELSAVDNALTTSFSGLTGLAIRLSRAQANQRRLSLLEGHAREVRILHEEVLQRLYGVGLLMLREQDAGMPDPRIAEAVPLLDQIMDQVRSSVSGFARAADDDVELLGALQGVADGYAGALGFRPEVQISGLGTIEGAPDVIEDLRAALDDCLAIVVSGGSARSCAITLSIGPRLVLRVADDSSGALERLPTDLVRSLRDRADRREGSVELRSDAGAMVLTWSVPFHNEPEASAGKDGPTMGGTS